MRSMICVSMSVILMCVNHQVYGVCDNGWNSFRNGCYKAYKSKKSWEEAKKTCAKEGANLPYPLHAQSNTAIQNIANNDIDDESDTVWLNGIYERGAWRWKDRGEIRWFNWRPEGETGEKQGCLIMTASTGKWTNNFCMDYQSPFICQKSEAPASGTTATTAAVNTTTNSTAVSPGKLSCVATWDAMVPDWWCTEKCNTDQAQCPELDCVCKQVEERDNGKGMNGTGKRKGKNGTGKDKGKKKEEGQGSKEEDIEKVANLTVHWTQSESAVMAGCVVAGVLAFPLIVFLLYGCVDLFVDACVKINA